MTARTARPGACRPFSAGMRDRGRATSRQPCQETAPPPLDKPPRPTHFPPTQIRSRPMNEPGTIRAGQIRAGMGGWTFEPWEGTFYPEKLPKKQQLQFAARQVPTIEINGTYYRGQTPETFAKWAADTPENFVFAVKGNRFVTNKKVLGEAGESMQKFWDTGVHELGDRLGPIVWQFAPTKKFEPEDFEAFLKLLPEKTGGVRAPPRAGGAPRLLRRAGIRRAGEKIQGGDLLRASPRLSRDCRRDGRFRLCAAAEGRGLRADRLHAEGARPLGGAREGVGRRWPAGRPAARRSGVKAGEAAARRLPLHHPRGKDPRPAGRHGADAAA